MGAGDGGGRDGRGRGVGRRVGAVRLLGGGGGEQGRTGGDPSPWKWGEVDDLRIATVLLFS